MTEPNSLIHLGEFSKPVTVLIEKISDAVGGIFLPSQLRRVAQAEADAQIIQAKASIHVTEIQQRAIRRLLIEEGDKQENIENITQKALPYVSDEAKPEDIEKDWLTNFFDKCRSVSDEEMQKLWSMLLAGEANKPGSCSKRTVSLLASMDRADAALFEKFCTVVWSIGELTPVVFELDNPVYARHAITFDSLSHLSSIGLISFNAVTSFSKSMTGQELIVHYYGEPHRLCFPHAGQNSFPVGRAPLTATGRELAKVCGSTSDQEVRNYIIAYWRSQGIECD